MKVALFRNNFLSILVLLLVFFKLGIFLCFFFRSRNGSGPGLVTGPAPGPVTGPAPGPVTGPVNGPAPGPGGGGGLVH